MKDFLSIGQIINTHGVKGELKIYPLTDDSRRFRKLQKVHIDGVEKKVIWCKLQNDLVILKIEGIESMDEAIKYKNKYLQVPREEAIKLPEGSHFVADLIGCTIFDNENIEIGKIEDVITTRSNDVYWVKRPKEVLVPAIKDIVLSIDIENKKIIIKPLEIWQ